MGETDAESVMGGGNLISGIIGLFIGIGKMLWDVGGGLFDWIGDLFKSFTSGGSRTHSNSGINADGTFAGHRSPVKEGTEVGSDFGTRPDPFGGKGHKHHAGLDFKSPTGRPIDIVATAAGVIKHSGDMGTFGQTIIIDHGNGLETLYAHMSGAKMPAVGTRVDQSDVIGVMGNTGLSTGMHLHYEQRVHGKAVPPVIAGVAAKRGDRFAGLANPADYKGVHQHGADGRVAFNGTPRTSVGVGRGA